MKENLLLIIFLIIWFGIAFYLFFLHREIKRIRNQMSLRERSE
ncbi:MAG: CcmD family protein [Desulfatiglandales bacterium]|jgi:CcmD family protein